MRSDSYSRYLRSEMYKDFLNGSKKKVRSFLPGQRWSSWPSSPCREIRRLTQNYLSHSHKPISNYSICTTCSPLVVVITRKQTSVGILFHFFPISLTVDIDPSPQCKFRLFRRLSMCLSVWLSLSPYFINVPSHPFIIDPAPSFLTWFHFHFSSLFSFEWILNLLSPDECFFSLLILPRRRWKAFGQWCPSAREKAPPLPLPSCRPFSVIFTVKMAHLPSQTRASPSNKKTY